jgi:hypothetical protein
MWQRVGEAEPFLKGRECFFIMQRPRSDGREALRYLFPGCRIYTPSGKTIGRPN